MRRHWAGRPRVQQSCGTPAQRWRQGCLRKLSAERPGTTSAGRPDAQGPRPPRSPRPTAPGLPAPQPPRGPHRPGPPSISHRGQHIARSPGVHQPQVPLPPPHGHVSGRQPTPRDHLPKQPLSSRTGEPHCRLRGSPRNLPSPRDNVPLPWTEPRVLTTT